MAEDQPHCQLILVTPTGEGAQQRLAAALGAGTVASVIIAGSKGQSFDSDAVKPLIAAAQKAGAAALLRDDAKLARTLKADGVHLDAEATEADYREAREIVGGRLVVGADAGRSRDAAMHFGEAGADYVAFGIPDFVGDKETARERRLDLVQWWAEIFEVPVVALDVATAQEAEDLARAGAEFVALTLDASMSPADAREAASALLVAISLPAG